MRTSVTWSELCAATRAVEVVVVLVALMVEVVMEVGIYSFRMVGGS